MHMSSLSFSRLFSLSLLPVCLFSFTPPHAFPPSLSHAVDKPPLSQAPEKDAPAVDVAVQAADIVFCEAALAALGECRNPPADDGETHIHRERE